MSSPALALTGAQQGVWLRQQFEPANPLYNAAECVAIEGDVDATRFEAAVRRMLAEVDVLSMRFERDGSAAVQRSCPHEWSLPVIDLRGEADADEVAAKIMDEDLMTPVDLTTGPLFVHILFLMGHGLMGPGRAVWYHRCHHIALDGYGFSLVANRVAQLYSDPSASCWFRPLSDVLKAEEEYRASADHVRDGQFWLEYLAEPLSVPRLSARTPSAGRVIRVGNEVPGMERLVRIAHRARVTWADVLCALIAEYLGRRTGAAEAVLGVPFMGRLGTAAARVPVMMVNMLVLRVPTSGDVLGTARAVARERRRTTPHGRYRFERIRRDLNLAGGRGPYGPVVNIMPFDYALDFDGYRAVSHNLSAGGMFIDDVAVQAHLRSGDGFFHLDLDAASSCYTEGELAEHFECIAALIAGED